ALYLAREYLSGPCIIVFVDTLFEADLSGLEQTDADAILFTQEVEDPRRFGVVVEEQGRITRLIEKPSTFEHRKAIIGLYYVKEGAMLREAIEQLLARNIQTKGEYYLADAFQAMIDQGAHVISQSVDAWEDCGEPETLLHTNRWLLEHGRSQEVATRNAILVPPVYVAPTAVIEDSVVGPYATIGDNVQIKDSIVRDAIVDEGSILESVALEHSLIGRNAVIKGKLHRLNIGDNSQVGVNGDI
ncbi:MAG: nucleotidyltransferase, partial [Chloroflexi bacterium]|nr:nucleotidyltransferase [Chloroflexota bacterium]